MTTYAPVFLGAGSITLGGTEYGPIVSSARLKPANKTVNFQAIDGTSYNFAGKPVWTLELNMAQDWAASGLGTYLNANVGTAVPCVYHPTTGGAGFTGTVILVAADIGGDFGTVAQSQIVLPVNGQPVQAAS